MRMIWQDVRYAIRLLLKSPVFSLTVIITLGLGIGLNSAIFSGVIGILLRDPPVKAPEHIFVVTMANSEQVSDRNTVSAWVFSLLRDQGPLSNETRAASFAGLVMIATGS